MRLAAGEEAGPIDRAVERLGLDFQISTRRTSWVAVSEEPTVDPTRPTRRERVAQELPFGMSAEGLGLRPASVPLGAVMRLSADRAEPMEELTLAQSAPYRPRRRMAGKDKAIARPRPRRPVADMDMTPMERVNLSQVDRTLPVRLAATLRTAGGRLILEAEVPGPGLEWAPPATVRVRLDDGTEVEAEVDLAATTAAAALSSGQVLRLVLRQAALDAGRVEEVALEPGARLAPLVLRVKAG